MWHFIKSESFNDDVPTHELSIDRSRQYLMMIAEELTFETGDIIYIRDTPQKRVFPNAASIYWVERVTGTYDEIIQTDIIGMAVNDHELNRSRARAAIDLLDEIINGGHMELCDPTIALVETLHGLELVDDVEGCER
ncbi:hypothetical protein SEA_JACOREN57_69 [Mycobacterium phage JacoRen57]|nr:hypothetical protein SEA_JACOREN57_69 [Mycobacterium phage JacoRen57]